MNPSITPAESFQNEVLRPILKSQNGLLIAMFRHQVNKRKTNFDHFSPEDQFKYIEQTIRKDLNFRSLLLGTIIGRLTTEQYEVYCPQEEELNRRTINMLIQRLQRTYPLSARGLQICARLRRSLQSVPWSRQSLHFCPRVWSASRGTFATRRWG